MLDCICPSCTKFVHPGFWHFENSSTSKIDDIPIEYVGLPHALPLAVHLVFYWWTSRGDHSKPILLFDFVLGPLLHA